MSAPGPSAYPSASPATTLRKGPSLRRKLAVMAVFGVVALILGEWVVRAFNIERLSFTNPALYVRDAELGYRMKPDVRVYSHGCWIETNRDGFRGAHWDDVHAAGKETVMFIGHSIAIGFGVTAEESYPGRFEGLTHLELAGVNMGHCRYGHWQEFALAQQYLDEIRPAATVVMFTGNDFEDTYDPFAAANIDGAGEDAGRIPIPGKKWLRRNSALYHYLRKSWSKLLVATGRREVPEHLYPRLNGDAQSREHFAAYEQGLRELKEASGVPMILTAFPMGQTPESYALLQEIAARVGARWVDLSDLWEDVADYRKRGALAWSEHPNAETHRIIAERLAPIIDELVLAARAQ